MSLIQPDVLAVLLEEAAKAPPGCFVEVGVYQGGSAYLLAELALSQGRAFYGYDTFHGIPYANAQDRHRVGEFADTSVERVRAAIPHGVFVAGVFPKSAVPMPPIAFAHIDCDQYQSVKETIAYLVPRMAPHGILWFDDYADLPEAKRAVDEWAHDRLEMRAAGRQIVRMA